jgi:hypothetical protein
MSDTPRRYRKLPIEVTAICWTGSNWDAVAEFVREDGVRRHLRGRRVDRGLPPGTTHCPWAGGRVVDGGCGGGYNDERTGRVQKEGGRIMAEQSKRHFGAFLAVVALAAGGMWFLHDRAEQQKEDEIESDVREFCESVAVTVEDLARCD